MIDDSFELSVLDGLDGCRDSEVVQHPPAQQRQEVSGLNVRRKLAKERPQAFTHDRQQALEDPLDNNAKMDQDKAKNTAGSLCGEQIGRTLESPRAQGLDVLPPSGAADYSNLHVNVVMTDDVMTDDTDILGVPPDGSLPRPISLGQASSAPMVDFARLQRPNSAPSYLRIEPPCSPCRVGRLHRNRTCLEFLSRRIRDEVLAADAIQQQQQDLAAEGILTRDFALEPATHQDDGVSCTVQSCTEGDVLPTASHLSAEEEGQKDCHGG